jgi:hypothetical protein
MVERTYHCDSSYRFDATADAFRVCGRPAAPPHLPAGAEDAPGLASGAGRGSSISSGAGAGAGSIDFLWAPTEPNVTALGLLKPDILVGGVHYCARAGLVARGCKSGGEVVVTRWVCDGTRCVDVSSGAGPGAAPAWENGRQRGAVLRLIAATAHTPHASGS